MTRQLTKIAVTGALAALLVSGCGKPGAEKSSGETNIEVAVFQGGFQLDFFEKAAAEFAKLQKEPMDIKVWGNPRIWEQLRPRFVSGEVPDLSWPGWGMDYWGLVYEGQVEPMDKYLDQPAYAETKGKWKDTFVQSLLERGKYNGHHYIMPYNFNAFAWWYNVKLFKAHRWQPPRTFDELLALGAKIKAAGVAPLTFQGRYPAYPLRGFFYPWAISVAGLKAYEEAQNLVPGAWRSPAFLRSAQMIDQLVKLGYFQKGAMAMSHTESQMEFVEGRAAMIPCGTWLYSEMKEQMPKDFEMDFILPPQVRGGKGDPTALHATTETWIIPAKAKHKEVGVELFRYMTSLQKAREFVVEKNTLMSIVGSDQVKLPKFLVSPARLVRGARHIWHADHSDWYPPLNKSLESALAALLNQEITPEQCVARMEEAAAKVRADSRLPKHTVEY